MPLEEKDRGFASSHTYDTTPLPYYNNLESVEKRLAALEEQIQRLPEEVVKHFLAHLQEERNRFAGQACRRSSLRRSKENSTGSCAE